MGEDAIESYSHAPTTYSNSYSNSYSVNDEESSANGPKMVPYAMSINEPYCMDDETVVVPKTFTDSSYHYERPQLHHMPSISTTCTSDSFQSSLTSADSGELSAYDLNASDSHEYDWSISHGTHFQWPPNRPRLHKPQLM